jgi:hypothetical protein
MNEHWCVFPSPKKMTLALVLGCAVTGIAYAGQESTIFSYDGHDFIRVQTTLTTEDGKSAFNTKLDPNSQAYKALLAKRSYTAQVTLFGQRCDANYAPLSNAEGQVTGALFVAICTKK